jgi:hypothetical protein
VGQYFGPQRLCTKSPDLLERVIEAFEEGTKPYFTTSTDEMFEAHLSEALNGLAADAVGAFLGTLTNSIFKLILRQQGLVLENDRVMTCEPLETGIQDFVKMAGVPENTFRHDKLRDALANIEKAEANSRLDPKTAPEHTATMQILQILRLVQIGGASALARKQFAVAEPVLQSKLRFLTTESKRLADRSAKQHAVAQRYEEKMDRIKRHPFRTLNLWDLRRLDAQKFAS